jgi:UDP-N-acetylglucosamine 2-epimerase (non-hydrolysing)
VIVSKHFFGRRDFFEGGVVMKQTVVALVMGTRPEAIKLAPVVEELSRHRSEFQPVVISTAQHRQMLDQVLNIFRISADFDLNVMQHNQTLESLTRRVLEAAAAAFAKLRPDCVLVQGDTTTALAASLAAFYNRIPVFHIEAGLRSRDLCNPYPEEGNRRLVTAITEIHFAPTPLAEENLLLEGVPSGRVFVTGNTVVDALHTLSGSDLAETQPHALLGLPLDRRFILVTSHRRESWGRSLENMCLAIRDLVSAFDELHIIYPVHLNPNVATTVESVLGGQERVHLLPPLDYLSFVQLLRRCHFVMTDSGGVQEEAPAFGKPVLVMRDLTERPEASRLGIARIVGTSRARIVREASDLLTDLVAYRNMSAVNNPYGDGKASARIVRAMSRWRRREQPLLFDCEQFSRIGSSAGEFNRFPLASIATGLPETSSSRN